MGRPNKLPSNYTATRKLHLERVPMVDYDYDPAGAYWGGNQPLYVAYDHECEIFVRGFTRSEAKDAVKEFLPNAIFYR